MALQQQLHGDVLIISASNVRPSKERSQSLQVSKTIQSELATRSIESEIADLRDYSILSCHMCEGCAETESCVQDDDTAMIMDLWRRNAMIVIVCPQYAGIPSKLMAIFEKIQEMAYLKYCLGKGSEDKRRKALIIAHGGMTESFEKPYKENIITPLGNILKSCGCELLNERSEQALCFGVKKYFDRKGQDSVCFQKEDDEKSRASVIDNAIALVLGNQIEQQRIANPMVRG